MLSHDKKCHGKNEEILVLLQKITSEMHEVIEITISWIGVLIAAIAAYATIRMLIIMKEEMTPKINKMSNNIGFHMERTKKELIYKRYFADRNITNAEFEESVKKAYADIMLLMPELDKKGKQDEDWYLGEWLYNERSYYDILKNKEKKDIAYIVYLIRRNNY